MPRSTATWCSQDQWNTAITTPETRCTGAWAPIFCYSSSLYLLTCMCSHLVFITLPSSFPVDPYHGPITLKSYLPTRYAACEPLGCVPNLDKEEEGKGTNVRPALWTKGRVRLSSDLSRQPRARPRRRRWRRPRTREAAERGPRDAPASGLRGLRVLGGTWATWDLRSDL